jgi:predicted RNA-binding protein with PUA-like domain
MTRRVLQFEAASLSFKLQGKAARNAPAADLRREAVMAQWLFKSEPSAWSNEGKAVVGIVEVSKAYRPDPTDASGKFGMVDIRALRPLPRPVTLEEAKSDKRLAKMALVTQSRLSVQPVTDAEWAVVCQLGGL